MASRTEKISEVLRSLRVSSPDIIGAAVVSIEGFIIASVAPTEVDEELVGGMAAALPQPEEAEDGPSIGMVVALPRLSAELGILVKGSIIFIEGR